MNILGIDYGLKSVGFAVGEQITNSCSTYFSKKFKNRKELVEKIKNLISEWDISTIVIGLPLNMDNSESEMSLEIRNFSKKLEKDINIKINFVDEKLTTYEAKQIMKGLNKNKQYIEKNNHGLAAKLILDSFMREKK
ncbi:MAG: Holliday junction resolvase RuvX [Pseudomonadota bacterium]|nr:Holliday junction resolvase RuvX [Pseudomonadota bacterium]